MDEVYWKFEHSVECNAKKSFAWQFWTDVANWERLEGKAVEWIRLEGDFTLGASGVTKVPGQDPYHWNIAQFEPQHSATIEMPLDGAVLLNVMKMESIDPQRTKITQQLSLSGVNAANYAEGTQMFETSVPQGLAKLAKTIEMVYKES